jgi:GT2 family glycosyltransferase
MRTVHLTVAIPSYQRRASLLRLIGTLAPEISRVRSVGGEVGVVAVIDGSTDGSAEALKELRTPFDLDVRWQENRGLAAARNVGLAAAADGLVLFFDDDLVPTSGLLARHYLAHQEGLPHVLLGPCRPIASAGHSASWLSWWEEHYTELARSGKVERFDQFTVANASGPAEIFAAAGGFDETFVTYGGEDYELGVRLLGGGVLVRYDNDLVAIHDHQEDAFTAIARQRSIGRNSVLLVELHPGLEAEVFPLRPRTIAVRLVAAVPVRSPHAFGALAATMGWLALSHPWALAGRAHLAYEIAHAASFAAGVAEADPRYLSRFLDGRAV